MKRHYMMPMVSLLLCCRREFNAKNVKDKEMSVDYAKCCAVFSDSVLAHMQKARESDKESVTQD